MSNTGVDYVGKKVVVGLTGRVASCVTALLLKKQGMNVIGVSIVTNSNDSFDSEDDYPKCHINNLDSVKKFCDDLKIPFYATDAKSEYDSKVIDPLVSNRLSAKANTSCFNCTRLRIKILYEKMIKLDADYISTGHFCKVHKNLNSEDYFIHSNNDPDSDQSFLLASIEGKYLKHLLLPLGELKKTEVDKIAQKFSLQALPSKDFKGFCFKKTSSYIRFARERVPKSMIQDGQVLNVDTDLFHGEHEGVLNHYTTEKDLNFKGLLPSDQETQIIGYDFVSGLIKIGSSKHLTHSGFQIVQLKFGSGLDRKRPIQCYLKNKYCSDYVKCNLFFKNNDSALIECDEQFYPLIQGESFVLFDRNTRNAKVIGYGTLGNIGDFELIDRVSEFRAHGEDDEAIKVEIESFKF